VENFLLTLNIVLPIFLVMVAGFACRRGNLVSAEGISSINKLVFKVFLPCSLCKSLMNVDPSSIVNPGVLAFAFIGVIIVFALGFAVIPQIEKENARRGVMIQGTFRSNFLLFGIPLGLSIGGASGSVLAAVVASFYVPVINMLSVISLYAFSDAENKSLKSALLGIVKNPLVLGGVSGLVFSLIRNSIGFELPYMIDTTLSNIKVTATPLAFLILGGDLKFGNMLRNVKVSIFSVLGKTVLIPAIMLPISYFLFGFNQLEMAILVAVFATPNAVSSYAMARNYEADYDLAGEIVTLSTLLSILTIFVVITLVKTLGWI
jgi:predicted permease